MSAHDIEQCILTYLREHGGSAPAGDVTAHAVAAGHAASTVRRIADRTVDKTRTGNAFTWSLRPARVAATLPTDTTPTPARAGRLVDATSKRTLWDAMKINGQPMSHDPGARYATPTDTQRRERLATEEPEQNDSPAWTSVYAALTQSERLHAIAQRPTVADYVTDAGWNELTESEAIYILEADDDGAFPLPKPGPTGAGAPLPY